MRVHDLWKLRIELTDKVREFGDLVECMVDLASGSVLRGMETSHQDMLSSVVHDLWAKMVEFESMVKNLVRMELAFCDEDKTFQDALFIQSLTLKCFLQEAIYTPTVRQALEERDKNLEACFESMILKGREVMGNLKGTEDEVLVFWEAFDISDEEEP